MTPLEFFASLNWIDGRPLLDTMEPYRQRLHMTALYTLQDDGTPQYNFVLSGRAKKNNKTTDLVLAAFYRLLAWESPNGNDCYILANDEDQAGDDLDLAKKLVAANPNLAAEVKVLAKSIERIDGVGTLEILPARDALGAHGKTALFIGFDEIHGYKDYAIFEALALDPTRADSMMWVTSYDALTRAKGVPIVDFKAQGQKGDDPRMLFSWYSAELCTDPEFIELPPEERANPSMHSWPAGQAYLDQQRRRLPTHRFRRLHLNLPGAPDGAFLDAGVVMDACDEGIRRRSPIPGVDYVAFVDMSGGSSDDAALGIAHLAPHPGGKVILDVIEKQDGAAPFDPRAAVSKFVTTLQAYGIKRVTGDNYAGQTFKRDFESKGSEYEPSTLTRSQLYAALEPTLNAGECRLLDNPTLQEQFLGLILRGNKIDHQTGAHDDLANAAAGALVLAASSQVQAQSDIISFSFNRDGFYPTNRSTSRDQYPRTTPEREARKVEIMKRAGFTDTQIAAFQKRQASR